MWKLLLPITILVLPGCATIVTDEALAFVVPVETVETGTKTVPLNEVITQQKTRAANAVRALAPVGKGGVTTSAGTMKVELGEVLYEVSRQATPTIKTYCGVPSRRAIDGSTSHTCLSDEDGDGMLDMVWSLFDQDGVIDISGSQLSQERVLETPIAVEPVAEEDMPTMTLQVKYNTTMFGGTELKVHSAENKRPTGIQSVSVKKKDLPKVFNVNGARYRILSIEDGLMEVEILSGFPEGVEIGIYNSIYVAPVTYVYY